MASSAADPSAAEPGALSGIRIADFSRVLAGPFATMILADLGAEVVKVERPGGGDDTRAWGPPYDAAGTATYFLAANRNKTSVTLDLTTPEGQKAARELAVESGIVVENFRPGVMARFGLGYEELRAERPDIVYCSISAFGSGAGAAVPGYDLIVQAVGGLMSITGDPEGEPQKVGVALVDVLAGLFTCVGLLSAVRHRERTGVGQLVEVNLLSSLLAALANQATGFTAGGVVAARLGNEHPSIAPYETLPTEDGQLALAVGNDRQFAALCARLGDPALAQDPRFVTNTDRVAHRPALRAALTARLAGGTTAHWADLLNRAGVPAGPVNDIAGAFALAESFGLNPIAHIGQVATPSNPIGMSRTPPSYRLPPPERQVGGEE
ncbi:CaiB/BaiF CoA transferase family protein [Streptomyces sp. NPDC059477]|uniref:CaiB/BaiF CoA transferase family protein n=1 Tax=Streptomyces sp. NPDC059477 TaxID=3346847 RepID=UPI0036C2E1D2